MKIKCYYCREKKEIYFSCSKCSKKFCYECSENLKIENCNYEKHIYRCFIKDCRAITVNITKMYT